MQFKLEQFEGPLDLLLQLIEDQKLEITNISLAQVTDQYIQYLNHAHDLRPEDLADFLVVAAKLLYLKSRALLPALRLDEEEADAGELEKQLKIYKEYLDASKKIEQMIKAGHFAFAREK